MNKCPIKFVNFIFGLSAYNSYIYYKIRPTTKLKNQTCFYLEFI